MNWWVFAILFFLFLFGMKKSDSKGSSWPAMAVAAAGMTVLTMIIAFVGFKLVVWLFWPIVIVGALIGLWLLLAPNPIKK